MDMSLDFKRKMSINSNLNMDRVSQVRLMSRLLELKKKLTWNKRYYLFISAFSFTYTSLKLSLKFEPKVDQSESKSKYTNPNTKIMK